MTKHPRSLPCKEKRDGVSFSGKGYIKWKADGANIVPTSLVFKTSASLTQFAHANSESLQSTVKISGAIMMLSRSLCLFTGTQETVGSCWVLLWASCFNYKKKKLWIWLMFLFLTIGLSTNEAH
jgi:hypothetical protein